QGRNRGLEGSPERAPPEGASWPQSHRRRSRRPNCAAHSLRRHRSAGDPPRHAQAERAQVAPAAAPVDRSRPAPARSPRLAVIAFADSSALLRVVFGHDGALPELRDCQALVASELLVVESLRTVDRLRSMNAMSIDVATSRRAVVGEWLESIDLVTLQRPILARASEPFPTPLPTLDALHLPTP